MMVKMMLTTLRSFEYHHYHTIQSNIYISSNPYIYIYIYIYVIVGFRTNKNKSHQDTISHH